MALTATIYNFSVELSDVDRGVYETFDLKLAQHPSESAEYMVARLLAYCFEYTDGIAFPPGGLSSPDEPAVVVRDLTGKLVAWIEVGSPDADRLHRASKTAERVVVYTHRDIRQLLLQLEGKKIHRREALAIVPLQPRFVDDIAARIDRRTKLSISRTEGHVYLSIGDVTLEGEAREIRLP